MSSRGTILRIRIFLAAIVCLVTAQLPGQVTGTIHAPNGKPVIGAEVFVNRSSYRALTDDFGNFDLGPVQPGFHEIVAYKKGFVLYRAPMRVVAGRSYILNLNFADTEKKPRGRSTPETVAALTQALVDEGVVFLSEGQRLETETADGKFRVLSSPIVLEYPNAGYRITAFFPPDRFIEIQEAAFNYQEYQGSNVNQNMSVEKSRLTAYRGSLRHFLSAVIAGKATEEGFTITDPSGSAVVLPAIPSATEGYSRITPATPLTIDFQGKRSTLTASGPLDANAQGILINARVVTLDGSMKRTGLSSQLPLDYKPIGDIESTFAEALRYFYEKVYVQTDKPYYYPGEPLWFKAYINYYQLSWRDSLSDVLYVELLSSKKKAILEKVLRIEAGRCHGDFILPDSIPEGTYYLRAYTNLRLNFGDSGLFTKPLHVLKMTDKVASAGEPVVVMDKLSVQTQKGSYRTREKITLEILLTGETPAPANLSVSVTDAAQVIALPEEQTIANGLQIDRHEIPRIDELKYRIERGVSFYGQFLNNKGAGEKTQLSFIQWKTGDVLSAETGDDGRFWQTGLQFTDSAQFSYKSDKAKGKPYGKVIILPREIPPLELKLAPPANIVSAGSIQRLYSEYEVPKDSKLLDEIEVRGSRQQSEEVERMKRRSYGRADHVLNAKQLNVNSGNLLWALVGKVPGLVVNPSQGVVYFSRAMNSSITNSASPLVMINDVPMAGDAGNILQTIDFNTIESIEFTNRLNSLYGTQGGFGVISVYTKTGNSVDKTDPNFQTIKLPGFSKTRKFLAPDYSHAREDHSQTDYRSTIYWNPDVNTDENGRATVSFFASDLAGLYRVVVEGVAADGRPVMAQIYLTIEEP
jgi:hypothetical protein